MKISIQVPVGLSNLVQDSIWKIAEPDMFFIVHESSKHLHNTIVARIKQFEYKTIHPLEQIIHAVKCISGIRSPHAETVVEKEGD